MRTNLYRKTIMSITNSNHHLLSTTPFKELEVNENYNLKYDSLKSNKGVIDQALADYPRIMAIRFDLHFPRCYSDIDYDRQNAGVVMTAFIKSLKAKIESNIERRRKNNKRADDCKLNYIWVKEGDNYTAEHFHVVIFLNNDTYNSLGRYGVIADNLYSKIIEAWASALKIEVYDTRNLTHFPSKNIYYLKKNAVDFEEVYRSLYKRISYFAKVETKSYGNNRRNYGSSYKKRYTSVIEHISLVTGRCQLSFNNLQLISH